MILITEKSAEGSKFYFINGAMLGETMRTNNITNFPTIEGTSFSDHYYRELESANFTLHASDVSKPLISVEESNENGGTTKRNLSVSDVNNLIKYWFKNAVRLEITSKRQLTPNHISMIHSFDNMILQSYSWSEEDLSSFNPTLTFKEARVQRMQLGFVENADQYYQAAYGSTATMNSPVAAETPASIGSALMSGLVGAAAGAYLGAKFGSIFPGYGTAIGMGVGALIGGGIGFFGTLFNW